MHDKKQLIMIIVACVAVVAAGGLFWYQLGGSKGKSGLSNQGPAEKASIRKPDAAQGSATGAKRDARRDRERENKDPQAKATVPQPGEEERPDKKEITTKREPKKTKKKDKPTVPAA